MLRAGLPTLLILAGACAEEPDFDTRYEEAEQSIEEKADAIDAELAPEVPTEQTPEPDAR